jgi:hypothetical protein
MGELYFQGPSFQQDYNFFLEPVKRSKRVKISLYISLLSKILKSREDLPFF